MLTTVTNLVRGALIGVAEVIPGVSGGTVTLIVGRSNRASGFRRVNSGTVLVESPAITVWRPGNFLSTIFLSTVV
jgi:uncharacterized membrane protein